MRKFTKIFSVLLVLTLLVGSLASCDKGKKATKLIGRADEALAEQAYTAEVRVEYDSNDENMLAAIQSFSRPSIKVHVDGEKFMARMDLKHGSDANYIIYTCVDGTLYTEWCEDGATHKASSAFSDEDKASLRDSFGEAANIGVEDFDDISVKSLGKVDVITCTGIKDAPLDALVASLEEQLSSLGADVAIKDATLAIEIDNDRYNVIILTCEYFITTVTDSYSIKMTYSTKFTYEKELEIVAPALD